MKKDGKELISIFTYYIVEYERKKTVYRTERDKDGNCEYYILTKDDGFIRVYKYGNSFSTESVKATVVDILPKEIQKEIRSIKKWYDEIEAERDKYLCESDYLQDYRMVSGTIDGFCNALYLAGVIKNRWNLQNYMTGTAE